MFTPQELFVFFAIVAVGGIGIIGAVVTIVVDRLAKAGHDIGPD